MGIIESYKGKFRAALLFGPPGSGKGTQGKFLSSAGNHIHLSMGDVFRSLSPESPAGQIFYKYASRGHLLPDDMTLEIWHHFVQGLIATNRFYPEQQCLLLDGIPRTLEQAKLLDVYIEIIAVILLETKHPEVLIQRMARRAKIERRADDMDEAVLEKRMEIYEKEAVKILTHYPKNIIFRFNADQKPLLVFRDILNQLADKLS